MVGERYRNRPQVHGRPLEGLYPRAPNAYVTRLFCCDPVLSTRLQMTSLTVGIIPIEAGPPRRHRSINARRGPHATFRSVSHEIMADKMHSVTANIGRVQSWMLHLLEATTQPEARGSWLRSHWPCAEMRLEVLRANDLFETRQASRICGYSLEALQVVTRSIPRTKKKSSATQRSSSSRNPRMTSK